MSTLPQPIVLTPSGLAVPELVGRAGKRASWRYLEFFTVNIRNANTRAAYGRAAASFLGWCEAYGIFELEEIQPMHVAAYVEQLALERWWLRLREKNGKVNEMPCHHKFEAYLDAYLSAARPQRRSQGAALPCRHRTHRRALRPAALPC